MSHQHKRIVQELEKLEKEKRKKLRKCRGDSAATEEVKKDFDEREKKLRSLLDDVVVPAATPEESSMAVPARKPPKKARNKNSMMDEHARRKAAFGRIVDVPAMEMELIKSGLAERNRELHVVPGDGSCLFRSISHQLQLRGQSASPLQLRKLAASEMSKDESFFAAVLAASVEEFTSFDQYLDDLTGTSSWGGEPEVLAVNRGLALPIRVYRLSGQSLSETVYNDSSSEAEPLEIVFHATYMSLGAHYNSVIVKS